MHLCTAFTNKSHFQEKKAKKTIHYRVHTLIPSSPMRGRRGGKERKTRQRPSFPLSSVLHKWPKTSEAINHCAAEHLSMRPQFARLNNIGEQSLACKGWASQALQWHPITMAGREEKIEEWTKIHSHFPFGLGAVPIVIASFNRSCWEQGEANCTRE